jgi:VRR-NUC domain
MSAGKLRRSDVKEESIERYLVEQVEAHDGLCEKFKTGKRGPPDRIVTWPAYGWARIHFVEVKTIGGKLDPAQERDHERRRKRGCIVRVLWTRAQVDDYIAQYAPLASFI